MLPTNQTKLLSFKGVLVSAIGFALVLVFPTYANEKVVPMPELVCAPLAKQNRGVHVIVNRQEWTSPFPRNIDHRWRKMLIKPYCLDCGGAHPPVPVMPTDTTLVRITGAGACADPDDYCGDWLQWQMGEYAVSMPIPYTAIAPITRNHHFYFALPNTMQLPATLTTPDGAVDMFCRYANYNLF